MKISRKHREQDLGFSAHPWFLFRDADSTKYNLALHIRWDWIDGGWRLRA